MEVHIPPLLSHTDDANQHLSLQSSFQSRSALSTRRKAFPRPQSWRFPTAPASGFALSFALDDGPCCMTLPHRLPVVCYVAGAGAAPPKASPVASARQTAATAVGMGLRSLSGGRMQGASPSALQNQSLPASVDSCR